MIKIEKNIPYPTSKRKQLMNDLMTMTEGDSALLSYDELTKTTISNCIANARLRMAGKGLHIKTLSENNGLRIWVFKIEKK